MPLQHATDVETYCVNGTMNIRYKKIEAICFIGRKNRNEFSKYARWNAWFLLWFCYFLNIEFTVRRTMHFYKEMLFL